MKQKKARVFGASLFTCSLIGLASGLTCQHFHLKLPEAQTISLDASLEQLRTGFTKAHNSVTGKDYLDQFGSPFTVVTNAQYVCQSPNAMSGVIKAVQENVENYNNINPRAFLSSNQPTVFHYLYNKHTPLKNSKWTLKEISPDAVSFACEAMRYNPNFSL